MIDFLQRKHPPHRRDQPVLPQAQAKPHRRERCVRKNTPQAKQNAGNENPRPEAIYNSKHTPTPAARAASQLPSYRTIITVVYTPTRERRGRPTARTAPHHHHQHHHHQTVCLPYPLLSCHDQVAGRERAQKNKNQHRSLSRERGETSQDCRTTSFKNTKKN